MASEALFKDLQPIGDSVYLFEPSDPASTSAAGPALITLCTWLGGATPKRIQKYVDGYQKLYPNSSILLITTRISEITVVPFKLLHARLAPARDVIRRIIAQSAAIGREASRSILLHIFSNGGSNVAIQLTVSLCNDPDHAPVDLGAHLGGIIFDCCPGDGSFTRSYQAAALSLPQSSPITKAIGKTLLYPFIGVIVALQQSGIMSSAELMREHLNDPALFGTTARRLYLYSKGDQIVQSESVESHQADARARLGCDIIDSQEFPDSPHCTLVRDHADRYWRAIETCWFKGEAFTLSVTAPESSPVDLDVRLQSRL